MEMGQKQTLYRSVLTQEPLLAQRVSQPSDLTAYDLK